MPQYGLIFVKDMDKTTILVSASKELECRDSNVVRLVGVQTSDDIYDDTYKCNRSQVHISYGLNQQFEIPTGRTYPQTVFTNANCTAVGPTEGTNSIYNDALSHNFTAAQLETACDTSGVCVDSVADDDVYSVMQQGDELYQAAQAMPNPVDNIVCNVSGTVVTIPRRREIENTTHTPNVTSRMNAAVSASNSLFDPAYLPAVIVSFCALLFFVIVSILNPQMFSAIFNRLGLSCRAPSGAQDDENTETASHHTDVVANLVYEQPPSALLPVGDTGSEHTPDLAQTQETEQSV